MYAMYEKTTFIVKICTKVILFAIYGMTTNY